MEDKKVSEKNLENVSGGFGVTLDPKKIKPTDDQILDQGKIDSVNFLVLCPEEYEIIEKAGYINSNKKINKEKIGDITTLLFENGFNLFPYSERALRNIGPEDKIVSFE